MWSYILLVVLAPFAKTITYTNVPKSPVIALSCELIVIKVINTRDNYAPYFK